MTIFRKNSTRDPAVTANNRRSDQNIPTSADNNNKSSFFARKRDSTSDPNLSNLNGTEQRRTSSLGSGSGRHVFSKHQTLDSAHSKLKAAVIAEKAADDALIASRRAVKEAKAEIALLEAEAKEEARAAAAKMKTASRFRKEGDKLGKH